MGRAVDVDKGPIRPYRTTPAAPATCRVPLPPVGPCSVSVWSYLSASRRLPSASWRVLVCLVWAAVRGRVRDGRRECRHDRTVSVTRCSSGAGGFNSPQGPSVRHFHFGSSDVPNKFFPTRPHLKLSLLVSCSRALSCSRYVHCTITRSKDCTWLLPIWGSPCGNSTVFSLGHSPAHHRSGDTLADMQ